MSFFIIVLVCIVFGAYVATALLPKKTTQASTKTKEFFQTTNVENPFPTGSLRTSPTLAVKNFYNWYVTCTQAKSCQLSDYQYIDKSFLQKVGNIHTSYNPILCSQTYPNSLNTDQQSNILDDTTQVSVLENFITNTTIKAVKIYVTVRLVDGSWYILNILCQNRI